MERLETKLRTSIEEAMRRSGITREQFEFFWETRSPFSQWHKCAFRATPLFTSNAFDAALDFSSAEQFMMLHKALLFRDEETARQIMMTRNVKEQKALGRQVPRFDAVPWDEMKVHIVYEGNKNKFGQNNDLQKALLATAGRTLVEAAPDDNVWGIGLHRDDARAQARKTWLGSNLLGEVLTALRIESSGTY